MYENNTAVPGAVPGAVRGHTKNKGNIDAILQLHTNSICGTLDPYVILKPVDS